MVYKFVVLSDEDESFVREFEFLDSNTLMDFITCSRMNWSLINLKWLHSTWLLITGKKKKNSLYSIWAPDLPLWKLQYLRR